MLGDATSSDSNGGGRPLRLALAVLAIALSSSACSLVFSESAGTVADAGQSVGTDSNTPAPDADGFGCGATLEDTLAQFPVEGDVGAMTLRTRSGLELGDVIKRQNQMVESASLDVDNGPSANCGVGVSVTSDVLGDYIRIPHGADEGLLAETQAIDFWFKTTNPGIGVNDIGALLTKDATLNNAGDLAVAMFRDVVDEQHYLLFRLQGGGASAFLNCSQAISLGDWHHVAISASDGNPATMYVDGVLADNTVPSVTNGIGGGLPCANLENENPARLLGLDTNTNDWMWGASNHVFDSTMTEGSGNLAARDALPMVMDELRFRSRPFTSEEAEMAYESVDLAP